MSLSGSPSSTVTASPDFIRHVHDLLSAALDQRGRGGVMTNGINSFASTSFAFPAYACAVAAVEAFTNEMFLSDLARSLFRDSPLWTFHEEWLVKLDILPKLVLVPQMLFNQTFQRDAQPYQDMASLVRLRNEIIHYKMATPPKCVRDLMTRKIALDDHGGSLPWAHAVSTSEGIRWAHNTACRTARTLVGFMPASHERTALFEYLVDHNFAEVEEATVRAYLEGKGVTI